MNLYNSIIVRYSLLIIGCILFVPLIYSFGTIFYYNQIEQSPPYDIQEIETEWEDLSIKLRGKSEQQITKQLSEFKSHIPESVVFWIDKSGKTRLTLPKSANIPKYWDVPSTIIFSQNQNNGNLYSIIKTFGQDNAEGVIIIKIPKKLISITNSSKQFIPVWIFFGSLGLSFLIFAILTYFYLSHIRHRFSRLQRSMKQATSPDMLIEIDVKESDEIADMEKSYNLMVHQLKESKEREVKEEKLRNTLIKNLSHDLRTPLTIIRTHIYSLHQESLSSNGSKSLKIIDDRIVYLSDLIDNLFSFTLLSSNSYPYNPKSIDVIETLRQIIGSWYVTLKNNDFAIIVDLPDSPIIWEVDESWFRRIWDNLIQNVIRYAKKGKYISVTYKQTSTGTSLILQDNGPGVKSNVSPLGTGIGLSIVSLMAKKMSIKHSIESNSKGTTCTLTMFQNLSQN